MPLTEHAEPTALANHCTGMLKVSEDHAKEAQVRLSGQTCTTKLPTYAAHPREGVYRRGGSVHIQNAPLLPS